MEIGWVNFALLFVALFTARLASLRPRLAGLAASAVVTAASLSNSGAITIGASDKINVAGTFLQAGTGTLTVQLGGEAASLMFGVLNAGGAATLGGTLQATLVNGYSPSINDGFAIVNYATQTGAFSSTQLPSSASYAFRQGVNPTYLGISALPASLSTAVNIAAVIDPASRITILVWSVSSLLTPRRAAR